MSDLHSFARDTERSIDPPPFEVMIAARRRVRRRAAVNVAAAVAAVAAVLALALAVAGLSQLHQKQIPARPAPQLLVPDWTPDQIIGHPDAFVITQVESRTHPGTTLTVWKRCVQPRPDHDCLGREAITVMDGSNHRFVTLGAVTGSSKQPSLSDDGLLRELGDGVWYWAHRNPGPELVSATMSQPVQLTVTDRPVAHGFGAPSIECADQVGLCTLNQGARTLERLAIPDVPATRWATPTTKGCGIWGLAGVGSHLRLIIQQRDGSFARADLPEDTAGVSMAEGGPKCEVAYYQNGASEATARSQLVVSLDQGKTWQTRQGPLPQVAGLYEQQPRLRVLIPPHWTDLPPAAHPLKPPGPLRSL